MNTLRNLNIKNLNKYVNIELADNKKISNHHII